MHHRVVKALVVAGLAIAVGVAARGQVQSVPGPGSGVVMVTGRVEVVDGMVRSTQNGDWKVTLAHVPDVRVVNTASVAEAPLPFLKQGARLRVTWPDNVVDNVQVGQLGSGGWIRNDAAGRNVWLNLALARYIEESR